MKKGFNKVNVQSVLMGTEFSSYDIQYVQEGVSTEVFRLKSGSTILYLRILPKEESLQAQILAHNLMQEIGVPVPKVVFSLNKVQAVDSYSIMITDEIPGVSIKHDVDLTNIQKVEILREAGRSLAKINEIEVNGVGWVKGIKNGKIVAGGNDYNDFVLNNLQNMLNELVSEEILKAQDRDFVLRYVEKKKKLFDIKERSYLAHGDFSINHIYHNEGKFTGIIDFGDIRGTTKYHDLGHVYTFDKDYFGDILHGYQEIFKLPSDYMERISLEGLIFGVSKLWWVSKYQPKKVKDHKVFKLLNNIQKDE